MEPFVGEMITRAYTEAEIDVRIGATVTGTFLFISGATALKPAPPPPSPSARNAAGKAAGNSVISSAGCTTRIPTGSWA